MGTLPASVPASVFAVSVPTGFFVFISEICFDLWYNISILKPKGETRNQSEPVNKTICELLNDAYPEMKEKDLV